MYYPLLVILIQGVFARKTIGDLVSSPYFIPFSITGLIVLCLALCFKRVWKNYKKQRKERKKNMPLISKDVVAAHNAPYIIPPPTFGYVDPNYYPFVPPPTYEAQYNQAPPPINRY